jgi:hypothetical protein
MREGGLGRVTQLFEGRRQNAFGGLGAQACVRAIGGRHDSTLT